MNTTAPASVTHPGGESFSQPFNLKGLPPKVPLLNFEGLIIRIATAQGAVEMMD